MGEGPFNSESSVTPKSSSEPASADRMLELRGKINDAIHGKKPFGKEEYDKLSAEIDTYEQNPYKGPEPDEPLKKSGFIESIRRRLRF